MMVLVCIMTPLHEIYYFLVTPACLGIDCHVASLYSLYRGPEVIQPLTIRLSLARSAQSEHWSNITFLSRYRIASKYAGIIVGPS